MYFWKSGRKNIFPIAVNQMLSQSLPLKPLFLVRSLWTAIVSVVCHSSFVLENVSLPKETYVNIVFKQIESIFGSSLQPNVLTIYIQPTEGFFLSMNGKEVGEQFNLAPDTLIIVQMQPLLAHHQNLMKLITMC